jgi:hypothetical protein
MGLLLLFTHLTMIPFELSLDILAVLSIDVAAFSSPVTVPWNSRRQLLELLFYLLIPVSCASFDSRSLSGPHMGTVLTK